MGGISISDVSVPQAFEHRKDRKDMAIMIRLFLDMDGISLKFYPVNII